MLKDGHIDRLGTNFEQQVKILIESEENLELREQLREYYNRARNYTSFPEEKLIEDILILVIIDNNDKIFTLGAQQV